MIKASSKATAHVRPYWHVDAKWVFGLLLGITLIVLLWIDTATRLTSREVAVPVTTAVIALQFSPDGLDDQAGLEKVTSEWIATGQTEFKPIEGMPLTLSRGQVESLSARELRLALFRQMAEPLYDNGVEGFAAAISDDPVKQEKFKNDARLLGVVSQKSHVTVAGIRWLALAGVILSAIPAIYFSTGLGRLITPGVVLLLASWAGGLIFGLSTIAINSSRPSKTLEQEGMAGMVWQEASKYLPTIMAGWIIVFGIGLGLLVTAAVLSLLGRLRSRS